MLTLPVKRKERLLRTMARMEKIAEGKEPSVGRVAKTIAAGLLGFGGLVGASLLARRGIRTHYLDMLKAKLRGKSRHALSDARQLKQMLSPKGAKMRAEVDIGVSRVISELRSRGIDPSTARIAVSGTGGTGKTTFSRALAREAKLQHVKLDIMKSSTWKGGHDVFLTRNPPVPGSITEQTHLFVQANPKHFDVMIHLERPTKNILKDLYKRKRGAHQASLYNYKKLHGDITTGFEAAGHATRSGKLQAPLHFPGQRKNIGATHLRRQNGVTIQDFRKGGGLRVRMKVRPDDSLGGWGAEKNLDAGLRNLGASRKAINDMLYVDKVQAASAGKLDRTFSGPGSYWKKEPLATATVLGFGGAGAAGTAAYKK